DPTHASGPAAQEADKDEAADPGRDHGDQCHREEDRLTQTDRETQQRERCHCSGSLESDEAVDGSPPGSGDEERRQGRKQHRGGDEEGVQTGSSDLRYGTRSWSRTRRSSGSTSTTYAFGLNDATSTVHARGPRPCVAQLPPGSRETSLPRTIRRRATPASRAQVRIPKSTTTMPSACGTSARSRSGNGALRPA